MISRFLTARFLSVLSCAVLLIFISVSLVSCNVFDDYFVRKQDYDSLLDTYNKNLEDFSKQDEILKSLSGENDRLVEENAEKDLEIEKMNADMRLMQEEILSLEEELDAKRLEELENQVSGSGNDLEKLRRLLDNINELLKFVYIGSSVKDDYGYTFTAFSIDYEGKCYIITAGHCVSDNYGKEGAFKFKANFSNTWIYPDLLGYKSEFYNLDDYAVFYSDEIPGGLKTGEFKTEGDYLLGSLDKKLSVFRNLGSSSKKGESGSPVINEEMEVLGIYVVYGYVYTPIQLALSAIDNAVIN